MNIFKLTLLSLLYLSFFNACTLDKKENTKTATEQHIQSITNSGDLNFSTGQMLYVPAYSQIQSAYTEKEGNHINLSVTLSIRNTDIKNPIIIK